MARKATRRPRRTPARDGGTPRPGMKAAPGATPAKSEGAQIVWLDPREIVWPEVRITSQYRGAEADALARSIEGVGQQQPIGVYLVDGQYVGADGLNRCQRAIERGEASVMCIVRQGTGADVLRSNIATALLRGHTNPLTVVETLWAAYHEEGVGIAELAMSAGRSVDWVERMLLIGTASPAVKAALGDEMIAQGHAEALAALEDHGRQEEALRRVLGGRWTVGELEDYLAGKPPGEKEDGAEPGPNRAKVPRACTVCHETQEVGGVQSMLVCAGCMGRFAEAAGDRRLAEAVRGALQELREAESALAGSPATVAAAECIGRLVKKAEGDASE